MEITENEGGGKTVRLFAGDRLVKVPKSHTELITPQIRQAFADPTAYFRSICERCSFQKMAKWLKTLIASNAWSLELHRGDPPANKMAGFLWDSQEVTPALVGPPTQFDTNKYPSDLQIYFSLVNQVHWNDFGNAGGLDGVGSHPPLSQFVFDYSGHDIDVKTASVWGWSFCGDMLIYTSDGRGGWFSHESQEVHMLGTIRKAINWVFAELWAGRTPEYDYDWGR